MPIGDGAERMNSDYKKNPCYDSTRTPKNGKKRCPQCWRFFPHPEGFVGVSGKTIKVCSECSKKRVNYYAGWRARAACKKR